MLHMSFKFSLLICTVYFDLVWFPDDNGTVSTKNISESPSSPAKNLLEAFNDADDEPIENMPDYEQYVSGFFSSFVLCMSYLSVTSLLMQFH